MENKDAIIVALELGTSHISAVAGKRVNGNMQILAYAEEPSIECVKRGLVYNIEKTTQSIRNVIDKLQQTLGKSISRVYVGIGGQSVRSVRTKVSRNMMTKSYITAEHIEDLRQQSYEMPYPDCERLATFVQGYIVDGSTAETPVGVVGMNIEGEYLNVIARHQLRSRIETCFSQTDVSIADTRVSAYELAQNVLSDQEKRAGSVLVDLGAGTTTVVVYKNNIVRHLVTLPIGMASITQDLTTLDIEESEAEQIKKKYGNAYIDANDEEANNRLNDTYTTTFGKAVSLASIQRIIEARLTEIILNVENQIASSNFNGQLMGGIVLTGGGSNMKNIEKAFLHHISNAQKIRIARTLNQSVIKNSTVTNLSIDNGMGNSIISLLISGEENCVGEPFKGKELWGNTSEEEKRAKDLANEAIRREEEMVQRLESFKDKLRSKITEVELTTDQVKQDGKDKHLRLRAREMASSAEEIQKDSNFTEALNVLQSKEKYKLTIKETQDLSERLAKSVDALNDAIDSAEKENSLGTRLKRWLENLATDE